MNLLIINDEILTAETMKTDIEWKNYGIGEVYTAYDAEQAKTVIQSQTVDIMLCDIEMPGDNGIELLRWVRNEDLPIECIFLTCHPKFSYAQEAITLNCQDYIPIPARYEEIGEGVLKVVRRIQETREALKLQEYGKRVVQEQVDYAVQQYGKKKTGREIVEEIVNYIAHNLGNEELTVNELGNQFYMHPVYINRVFKKEMKISVSQYINEERMKLAAELLKSGQLSANIVAEQVGYHAYSNFSNMFKKYYGCSPTEYMKKSNQQI